MLTPSNTNPRFETYKSLIDDLELGICNLRVGLIAGTYVKRGHGGIFIPGLLDDYVSVIRKRNYTRQTLCSTLGVGRDFYLTYSEDCIKLIYYGSRTSFISFGLALQDVLKEPLSVR